MERQNVETERLTNRHEWFRIADATWSDPLNPTFAGQRGGRWNPPNSYPTLYVNEDEVTARINMRLHFDRWPVAPEELRPEHAPVLIGLRLPRDQTVADAHTPDGVAALGLPHSYPVDGRGVTISHAICQPVGQAVFGAGLRGIRCRSAQTRFGAGRELAWFPATGRSQGTETSCRTFSEWFWA